MEIFATFGKRLTRYRRPGLIHLVPSPWAGLFPSAISLFWVRIGITRTYDNSNCDWVVDLSFSTSTRCAYWAPWTSLDLSGSGEARILILIVVHHRPTVVAPVLEALRRVAGFTGNYPHLFQPRGCLLRPLDTSGSKYYQ